MQLSDLPRLDVAPDMTKYAGRMVPRTGNLPSHVAQSWRTLESDIARRGNIDDIIGYYDGPAPAGVDWAKAGSDARYMAVYWPRSVAAEQNPRT